MNDNPQSKRRWRWLRRGGISLAVLATLIAAFITEENWRGKADWDAFKQVSEARGDRLDMAIVIPPPVPDDQNFFAAPGIAGAFNKNENLPNDSKALNFDIYRGHLADSINQDGNWQKGTLTDLKQWQDAFRRFSQTPAGKTNGFPIPLQPQSPAADVLLALSVFDPGLEKLRRASQRPSARMPLKYEEGFEAVGDLLPWLGREKQWIQYLQLRIVAELQAGQSQPALDDLKLCLKLTDATRNQPFFITHLVRMAMMFYVIGPVYEGLVQHRWNDAQLADLESALATQNFLADFQIAMRGERTCAVDYFEKQRLTREMKSATGENGDQIVTNSLRWMPSAYFYQNELAVGRMYQQFVFPLVDLTNQTISFVSYRAGQKYFAEQTNHYSPYKIQSRLTYSSICKSIKKFAFVQTSIDLARTACALERYHLAHGEYPAVLDTLAPQFIDHLPHDLINGQPLHYHRTDDGRFILYSVGLNEKDDGGTIVLSKDGTVDRDQGDWVWQYPAK